MVRSARAIIALLVVVATGCGNPDSTDSSGGASGYVAENAGLRRITMEEFADVSIELDYSTIGGFDLEEFAPAADIDFCTAASTTRVAWIDGSAMALQLWYDTHAAASDVPADVRSDVGVLLEHVAQRIAWNFRRADEPVVDDRIVDAAHGVVSAAVERCEDLPLVVGTSDDQLRSPWAEGSYDDRDPAATCTADLADVAAAVERYVDLRQRAPLHLEQVEAALLADESMFFSGSVLHAISGQNAEGAVIEPIDVGPCGG